MAKCFPSFLYLLLFDNIFIILGNQKDEDSLYDDPEYLHGVPLSDGEDTEYDDEYAEEDDVEESNYYKVNYLSFIACLMLLLNFVALLGS